MKEKGLLKVSMNFYVFEFYPSLGAPAKVMVSVKYIQFLHPYHYFKSWAYHNQ